MSIVTKPADGTEAAPIAANVAVKLLKTKVRKNLDYSYVLIAKNINLVIIRSVNVSILPLS